ncbi:MAG: glycerate kinase, partial [Actinomycetota bacterium]
MRVLVAPDKFKGTLTASQAARAIGVGWRRERPEDEIDELPLADGGEGTLDTLVDALGGAVDSTTVTGPLGDPIEADYGIAPSPDGDELIGIVEMARASGLELIAEARRNPLLATTRGTGELILAAASHRPASMIVCIGGSATNDGGASMAQALGARLRSADGTDIGPGGEALLNL